MVGTHTHLQAVGLCLRTILAAVLAAAQVGVLGAEQGRTDRPAQAAASAVVTATQLAPLVQTAANPVPAGTAGAACPALTPGVQQLCCTMLAAAAAAAATVIRQGGTQACRIQRSGFQTLLPVQMCHCQGLVQAETHMARPCPLSTSDPADE